MIMPELHNLSTDDAHALRVIVAITAMHGELASQGDVDWSGRPKELAELSVAHADALLTELAVLDKTD